MPDDTPQVTTLSDRGNSSTNIEMIKILALISPLSLSLWMTPSLGNQCERADMQLGEVT